VNQDQAFAWCGSHPPNKKRLLVKSFKNLGQGGYITSLALDGFSACVICPSDRLLLTQATSAFARSFRTKTNVKGQPV